MSWDNKQRAIDRWRREVAGAADPVVVPSSDRAFRRGAAEPSQVLVDDGLDPRSSHAPSSVDWRPTRKSKPRVVKLVRRASSYDGAYSRRSTARSPTRAPTTTGRQTYARPKSIVREEPPPTTIITTSKPRSSMRASSLIPPSRSSRSKTVVYDKPRKPSLSPVRRRYFTTRTSDPDVTILTSRPRGTATRQEPRRGSVDMEERMRLLAIRDQFRDEVERARRWHERPVRHREYDRR